MLKLKSDCAIYFCKTDPNFARSPFFRSEFYMDFWFWHKKIFCKKKIKNWRKKISKKKLKSIFLLKFKSDCAIYFFNTYPNFARSPVFRSELYMDFWFWQKKKFCKKNIKNWRKNISKKNIKIDFFGKIQIRLCYIFF